MASLALPNLDTLRQRTPATIPAGAARVLQAGWCVLLAGALLLAVLATPLVFMSFQTVCPEIVCEVLPRPNAATIELLGRANISLPAYASVMVAVEWVSMLIWCGLGALLIWARPQDIVALLLAYSGIVAGNKAFVDALGRARPELAVLAEVGVLISTVTLPLLLALFPDGRWVPRWAPWLVALPLGYSLAARVAGPAGSGVVQALEIPLTILPLVALVVAQAYRYRVLSTNVQRQQTKWVLTGLGAYVAFMAVGSLLLSSPDAAPYQLVFVVLCYGVFAFLGVAMTCAVLRYRLFAIDSILHRSLVYGLLTLLVVGLYATIVVGVGALLQAQDQLPVSLFATVIVAILFTPLRDRLQRGVNRLLYGDRDDPYQVLTRLGQQVEASLAPGDILPTIASTMTDALRLPYVGITLAGQSRPAAEAGTRTSRVEHIPLTFQQERVGDLILTPRDPDDGFTPAEQRLLRDLARQISVAAHGVRVMADLQRSREQLVLTREEERRRLRRDLHDGLGAQLAALALQAGALRHTVTKDAVQADVQAGELQAELRAAVGDIRRLVHGLRPPALDELGLVPALRQRVARFGSEASAIRNEAALVVSLDAPEDLPSLSAALEVAIYRIVDEALVNVARHANARHAWVRVGAVAPGRIQVSIADDGGGISPERGAGVGLLSMRERAEELGARFAIGPNRDGQGTLVTVDFPLPDAEDQDSGHA
jgi:signal transduction histidine kinase